jgi:hypothetical protein
MLVTERIAARVEDDILLGVNTDGNPRTGFQTFLADPALEVW